MQKITQSRLLIVFAKNTVGNQVKSRLASKIGAKKALRVYEMLSARVKRAVVPAGCDIRVFYYPEIQHNDLWDAPGIIKAQQHGKDIGERMKNAMQSGFDSGYSKVGLVGTDIPDLTTEILAGAFEKLETHEVVFGPAEDGGYYLVGMSKMIEGIFGSIPWSTDKVLSDSLEILSRMDITPAFTETLRDVDTIEDLKATGL